MPTDSSLGRLETRLTTRASPVALHDHGPPGDIMNFEMTTEVVLLVGVRGGGPLMEHHDQILPQEETVFASLEAAIPVGTLPHATLLVILLAAQRH